MGASQSNNNANNANNVNKSNVSNIVVNSTGLPVQILNEIGFKPVNETITRFENVSLTDIIKANSTTRFIDSINTTCYKLNYITLNITTEQSNTSTKANYINNVAHSLIGEEKEIILHTYSQQELHRFLDINKGNTYTFLPLTVHAVNSASGKRCDMLIIFKNDTKQVYWFDSRIHTGYLRSGRDTPRDAVDILLTVLMSYLKLDYSYEAVEAWTVAGVFNPMSSLGKFDFLLTSAWCYLTIKLLPFFSSPIEYSAALDSMSREDRFNLLYTATNHMITRYFYQTTIPDTLTKGFDLDKFDPTYNDNGTLKQDSHYNMLRFSNPKLEEGTSYKMTQFNRSQASQSSQASYNVSPIKLHPNLSDESSQSSQPALQEQQSLINCAISSELPNSELPNSELPNSELPNNDHNEYNENDKLLETFDFENNENDKVIEHTEIDVDAAWESAIKQLSVNDKANDEDLNDNTLRRRNV